MASLAIMEPDQKIRTRYSVQELCTEPALKGEMDKVIKAFRGVQKLPPSDPNSFYFLGGFRGEPFRGPNTSYPGPNNNISDKQNVTQKLWWGGYCNHENVLFPTWHRAHMHRFEKALQSIEGCHDVMLPFWDDERSPYDLPVDFEKPVVPQVIPEILTKRYIPIDGKMEKNPLFSHTLQRDTTYTAFDRKNPKAQEKQNSRYSKPKGYGTCRFPKRGIACNPWEKAISQEWNESVAAQDDTNEMTLNINVAQWLQGSIKKFILPQPEGEPKVVRISDTSSVYSRFQLCLKAPNYIVFSNIASQRQWIADLIEIQDVSGNDRAAITSLESPHNAMHLAIGGFYQEGIYNANAEQYQQANGDMGDNETASFDPIFFFHHAFIDYVFWTWQKKHGLTQRGDLEVLQDYPGTMTDEASPVGLAPGAMLTMSTPLYPFRPERKEGQTRKNDGKEWVTSDDVTDIRELGYEYGKGSLDKFVNPAPKTLMLATVGIQDPNVQSDVVGFKETHGINRAEIEGSFVVKTLAKRKGEQGSLEIEVGREAVLSRLNVRGCKNCQTHLEAQSQFPIYQGVLDALGVKTESEIAYRVVLDTHDTAYRLRPDTALSDAQQLYPTRAEENEFAEAMSILRIDNI